ncbi:hypothetical protein EG68_10167 [Paragonimus skrjabini miyazakii]|uniref:UspA domain-containing protein n=1 Tax=Paragonimus skrjabini miyazakii TaxID=59628 RepID=A0A8S9YN74_9TREM|nr:hypothetical protein EG68_10167 [Paragonimus skrjabini miyazakii]
MASGGQMPAANKKNIRNILIPVDGSTHSEQAFKWYMKHMKRDDDNVTFINVIEPVYTSPAFGLAMESPPLPDVGRVMEESIEIGKKLCQQCMREAKSENLNSQAYLHVDSRPGPAIVKSVTDHGADVVVMANRGLGVLRRTFLGSVSDYVLHHAHAPVVIVPPSQSETK